LSAQPPPRPGIAQKLLAERQQLPGLIPQEIAIFKAWWAVHEHEYTSADFNVRVGVGVDPGAQFDEATRRTAVMSTQYRVDALLHTGNQAHIVEVKFRASPLVLGQILSYRELWLRSNPGQQQPILRVLYFQTNDDTLYVLDKFGVLHDQVDADFSTIKVTKQI